MTKTMTRTLLASVLFTALQLLPLHVERLTPGQQGNAIEWVNVVWGQATLNVKNFGARGDGINNDTAAISAALTAARDGDIIFFPAGIYLCNDAELSGKNGITVRGRGQKSIIRNAIASGTNPILTFTAINGLIIQDIVFDNRSIQSFGGVRFYDTENVLVDRTRFFDSAPLPLGNTDRYAYVFGNGTRPHKNIRITNNLIEDLQLEVDFGHGVTIYRNTVKRSVRTGAIGLFTIDDGVTLEDYSIDSNIIIDPVGAGIALNVDPPDNNNTAFRNIAITNNTIIFNHTPTGAIHAGPADGSTISSGNIYEGVVIRNNLIQIAASAAGQPEDTALIKFNAGANSALSFKNSIVDKNQIEGGGNTALGTIVMDLRFLENSTVTANTVSKTFAVMALNRLKNTKIEQNSISQISDYPPYLIDNSRGGMVFQNNYYSGPVTTPLTYLNGSSTDVIFPPIRSTKRSRPR